MKIIRVFKKGGAVLFDPDTSPKIEIRANDDTSKKVDFEDLPNTEKNRSKYLFKQKVK